MLAIENLRYGYPDGTEAIKAFSCAIREKECVGMVGPNGSGKTTLTLLLAGFLQPQGGEISVAGRKMSTTNISEIRRLIGFTFHNPDDQLFMPTVIEDVMFGLLCAGMAHREAEERARHILSDLGIGGLAEKFPGHLSAGQKRMATIAGVLVMEPKMLVLDEPSAFLDPFSRRQLMKLVGGLVQTRLIITHDLEMAAELCARIIVISDGAVVAEGKPDEVLADTALMARYHLEVPAVYKR